MSSTNTHKTVPGAQNTTASISRYLHSPATPSPSSSSPSYRNKFSKKKTNNAMLEYYLAESPRDGANMYCRCHSGYHPATSPSSQSSASAVTSRKQESAVDAFDIAITEKR